MSHVKETTLLEYVIAYLQEEQTRSHTNTWAHNKYTVNDKSCVKEWFTTALDAYARGAR